MDGLLLVTYGGWDNAEKKKAQLGDIIRGNKTRRSGCSNVPNARIPKNPYIVRQTIVNS